MKLSKSLPAVFLTLLASAYFTARIHAQNVGIGIANPPDKLSVQTIGGVYGITHTNGIVTLGTYIANNDIAPGGYFGTRSNHSLHFFTDNHPASMTITPDRNIGIGTVSPTNRLQINGATPGFSDYDFAIGRNAQSMAIYQGPNFTNLVSTANITINPKNATGYVGINVGSNPSNRLQIGALGNVPFNGNDLAIGNGTAAMAVYQSNTSTLIASTTDMVLRPRNNGQGRVGINTNTPRAPLDVTDYVARPGSYYSYLNRDAWTLDVRDCQNCLPAISIFASNAIFAAEFDAFSDARIKDITGKSNSSNDLQTINALVITNYTMKDKVRYSNKPFKKVIAQEVEKVYPQVVSKHTDFVPNVYQVTSKIEKIKDGFLLSFSENHNISSNAKKLRVLASESEGMQELNVVSIPSVNQVVIKGADLNLAKVFVYGEEVNDFRTVDYEGLTTLNISATQELSKQLQAQQLAIDAQNKKIEALMETVKLLQEKTGLKHALITKN